jgi:hypothetical protein
MRNTLLEKFARNIPIALGYDFCTKYKFPISAFLVLKENDPDLANIFTRGLSHSSLLEQLGEILASDKFLLNCCGKPEALAKAIDILFLKKLKPEAFPAASPTLAFVRHRFEEALAQFEQDLFEQRQFKRRAYFHLFNLTVEGDIRLQSPLGGWFVQKLDPESVAVLFGESSAFSFISPSTTGTCFLVCEDTVGFEAEDLYAWLSRRWTDAQPYRQVLQYTVDGIVDIDYACPYFLPKWVNEVHKWGLYYLGEPRREHLSYPFHRLLFSEDQEQVNQMWRTYVRHRDEINATGSTLRRAIRIAGNFFEDYHRKTSRVEQFASLMIDLEALFTPSGPGEYTFRVSQNCALLSAKDYDADGRQEVFEFLKKMFTRRGKLFHGQIDISKPNLDQLVTDDEIHRLASLVRKSILRFIALYLRGERDLEELRSNLQKAAFDEGLRNNLLANAEFEAFIDDRQTSLLSATDLTGKEEPTDSTEGPPTITEA